MNNKNERSNDVCIVKNKPNEEPELWGTIQNIDADDPTTTLTAAATNFHQ